MTEKIDKRIPTNGKVSPEDIIINNVLAGLDAINADPKAVFELTNIRKGRNGKPYTEKGYFSDRLLLATEAAALTQEDSSVAIYVNAQAIHPECIHRAFNRMAEGTSAVTGSDVLSYLNFVVDIDRKGIKHISSTEEEKRAIWEALAAIQEYLVSVLDWPDPKYTGDSGNGGHIDWALDLPNTPENQALIKQCYKALDERFSTEALAVDQTMSDPNQLLKLYGTKCRKGDDTDTRPHRYSKIVSAFETVPVPLEKLQALANQVGEPVKKPLGRGKWWKAETPEAVEAWATEHEIGLEKREKWEGGYKWRVNCLLSDAHSDGAALLLNKEGFLSYKCHHDSCAGNKRIALILDKYPPPVKEGAGRPRKLGEATEVQNVLSSLGYHFTLNVLENYVFVNGKFLDDIEADIIQCKLVDLGLRNFTLMDKVFHLMASDNRFHPVVDYFKALTWDGKDHLADLLKYLKFEELTITYADGSKADYNAAVFRKWLLGVVAQVMESSTGEVIRFQNPMLVLCGKQWAGKSTLVRWLCPAGDEYHNEGSIDPEDEEHARLAVSKTVWEVTELSATMRKSDKDALKAFLTQTKSTYRPPWGRRPITKPRMCSYVGTVNPEGGFLSDVTGERRYLPVEVASIDWDYAAKVDKDQLWAQIFHEFMNGASPTLSPEEKAYSQDVQADHKVDDPLIDVFERVFVIDPGRANDPNWQMFTADIINQFNLSVHSKPGMLHSEMKRAGKQVSEVLLALGLNPPKNVTKEGRKAKGYAGIRPVSQIKEEEEEKQKEEVRAKLADRRYSRLAV